MERTKLSTKILGFSLVHIAVCLVFLKGFLLTRVELPDVSQCPPQGCRAEAEYSKAVVLIVDALRYDFVCEISSNDSAYMGKLPKTLAHVATAVSATRCTWFPGSVLRVVDAVGVVGDLLPTYRPVGASDSATTLTLLVEHVLLSGQCGIWDLQHVLLTTTLAFLTTGSSGSCHPLCC